MEKLRRTSIIAEDTMNRRRQMAELDKELRVKQAETGMQISKDLAELRKEIDLVKASVKLSEK